MSYKGVCTPGKGPGEGGALKSLSASELLFSGPLVLRVYVISIVEKKLLCFFVRKKERKYNLFVNKKKLVFYLLQRQTNYDGCLVLEASICVTF